MKSKKRVWVGWVDKSVPLNSIFTEKHDGAYYEMCDFYTENDPELKEKKIRITVEELPCKKK